jgi:hypothetical protein
LPAGSWKRIQAERRTPHPAGRFGRAFHEVQKLWLYPTGVAGPRLSNSREAGGDAVPIAGGQSLLAGLNMRLSAPKLLVDIGDLRELMDQSHVGGVVRSAR